MLLKLTAASGHMAAQIRYEFRSNELNERKKTFSYKTADTMKINSLLVACLLSLSALQAAEIPATAPKAKERLAFTWINSAKRIDAGKRIIYYKGDMKRTEEPGSAARVTVSGEVLLVDGDSVVAAPEVSLAADGSGTASIKGPSNSVAGSADPVVQARIKDITGNR